MITIAIQMIKSALLRVATTLMHVVWRWSRGLTMGVQCCLIDSDGRIMLVRHGYRPGWHFPGGGIEKQEPALDALERELSEEVGVTLDATPQLVGPFANFKYFRGDHVLLYVARDWTQTRQPNPNFEIAEIKRFSSDKLPGDIHPPTRERIKELLEKMPHSRHWHT